MRIALYARVSTDDQHPEAQLGPLREYAARRGAQAVEYVDLGVSGRKDRRAALDAILAATRRREIEAVVVVRLDRLARSLPHLARLGEELSALGVELVSLTEGIDTSTPTGRALYGMCGVFAQLEVDLLRERTVAGLRAAVRRGKRLGRPEALDAAQQERARRLAAHGHSERAIAEQLGTSRGTIRRVLGQNRPCPSEASSLVSPRALDASVAA
jgi:DNA invertase Pin-like site-specific DNA recombinase